MRDSCKEIGFHFEALGAMDEGCLESLPSEIPGGGMGTTRKERQTSDKRLPIRQKRPSQQRMTLFLATLINDDETTIIFTYLSSTVIGWRRQVGGRRFSPGVFSSPLKPG